MTSAAAAIVLGLLATPTAGASDVVRTGLKWLAAKQKPDGSWEVLNKSAPTATTATAGLAFLMEGSTPKDGAYAAHIRKAMVRIEANQTDTGLLAGPSADDQYTRVHTHTQALLFLACAHEADDEPARRARFAKVVKKATAYLLERQSARGGWVGTAGAREGGDESTNTHTTAIVLQALLAVRTAGIEVPARALAQGFEYIERETKENGSIAYWPGGKVPGAANDDWTISADAAAAARRASGPRPAALPLWVKHAAAISAKLLPRVAAREGGGAGAVAQQFAFARVAFVLGESGHRRLDPTARDADLVRWSSHRTALFKALRQTQHEDGYWSDGNQGPVYATALALILLQLDNGYIPAFSR